MRVIKGRVLNVGLGPGDSTQYLLCRPEVEEVVSVEINPEVVERYKAQYGEGERHIILTEDARTTTAPGPFDYIWVDILDDTTEEHYAALRDFLLQVKALLKPGGWLRVEWQSDVPPEREMRKVFMPQYFEEQTFPVEGRRGSIRLYSPK